MTALRRLVAAATLTLIAGAAAAVAGLSCVGDDPTVTERNDASTDTELPDSSVVPDAGPDAIPFCQTPGVAHDLCIDFDGDIDLLQLFKVLEVAGTGSTPTIVHDAGTPTPFGAMRAELERGTSPQGYNAARYSFQQVYPPATSRPRLSISFDLYVARADGVASGAASDENAGTFVMNLDAPMFALYLSALDGGASLAVRTVRAGDGGSPAITEDRGLTMQVGAWTHFVVGVAQRTADPSTAGATLSVGGKAATYALASEPLPSGLRADLGLGTTNAAGVAWTVYYDNVTIDFK